LVLHETAGFRHDSIPAGVAALTEVAGSLGLEVSVAETSSPFVDPGLDDFHVVVFLCTTGDVLDETEQSSMEAFVRSGGGFVGIHSAADTEHEWPWYGGLIGASFVDHSTIQPAVVRSTLSGHPAGVGLPEQFERLDEWYNFRELPGPEVDVLATIDESTYEGGTMGANHPIAWAHEYEGGRAFYTGFGHTIESYVEDVVVDHLTAGLAWAAGIDGEQSSA
jgi:type 1 glutamine amidotransferase